VNQEHTTAFEPNNQIFAATLEAGDALTLESLGDRAWVVRPRQAPVADHGVLNPPSDDERFELPANRLDLGKLGHAP
jgi:hypothetical protein